MVEDVTVFVDREFAGIEFFGLLDRKIQRPALDDIELVGEFSAQRLDRVWPFLARLAKQVVLDEHDGALHEAPGVVVSHALDRSRDDKIGKKSDGDERTHHQQIETQKQSREAIAAAPGRGFVAPENVEQAAVAAARVIASHAC